MTEMSNPNGIMRNFRKNPLNHKLFFQEKEKLK